MSLVGKIANKYQRTIRQAHYALGMEARLYQMVGQRDLILMFHNVFPETRNELNLRNISQPDFRKIMKYVKSKYDVVSLSELADVSSNQKRVAITFDDGLVNNLRYAVPVLADLDIPATIFITTSWLHGQNILWPDELSLLLRCLPEDTVTFDTRQYTRGDDGQFKEEKTGIRLDTTMIYTKHEVVLSFISQLKRKCDYEPDQDTELEDEWRVMKGEEIKILKSYQNIEIGSHTISHRNLNLLNDSEIREELEESKKYLEQIIAEPVNSIAFPFGIFDERVLEGCQKAGYINCIGVNSSADSDSQVGKVHYRLGIYNDRNAIENLHLINSYFE